MRSHIPFRVSLGNVLSVYAILAVTVILARACNYLCFYLTAYYFGEAPFVGLLLVISVFLLPLMVPLLLCVWIYSIFAFNLKTFLISTFLVFLIPCTALMIVAIPPPPGDVPVYGIRDRILSQYSIEDIRSLGKALTVYHRLRIYNRDLSQLPDDEVKEFHLLEKRYPFLNYNVGMESAISVDDDGTVVFDWGSGVLGDWGFQVGSAKSIKDFQNVSLTVKAAPDISFFCSED